MTDQANKINTPKELMEFFAFSAFSGWLGLGEKMAELNWDCMPEQDKNRWRDAIQSLFDQMPMIQERLKAIKLKNESRQPSGS